MVCPRCDGQGNVYRGRLEAINLTLYVCDECEAYWLEGKIISKDTFKNLCELYSKESVDEFKNPITDREYNWEEN